MPYISGLKFISQPRIRDCLPHSNLQFPTEKLSSPVGPKPPKPSSGSSVLVTMPTPESELFKKQKPKVPPTFNGVDYDDTRAFKQAQDAIIREQWVGVMMTRLVGQEMGRCYRREGVNHLEKCGHLRGEPPRDDCLEGEEKDSDDKTAKYLELLEKNKVTGTMFLQQNYISHKEEEIDLEAKVHPINKIARMNDEAGKMESPCDLRIKARPGCGTRCRDVSGSDLRR